MFWYTEVNATKKYDRLLCRGYLWSVNYILLFQNKITSDSEKIIRMQEHKKYIDYERFVIYFKNEYSWQK